MTWSIFIVFLSYEICTAPVLILTIADKREGYGMILAMGASLLLYVQNFVVYALRNEQYQKSYMDYLRLLGGFVKGLFFSESVSNCNEPPVQRNLKEIPRLSTAVISH